MTVWSHLPTIFNRRFALRKAGLIALCVAFITTLLLAIPSSAVEGTNQTLSFQGRLLTSTGGLVPDGNYNIEFKIYQDGTGTTAGNPSGSLEWTETYINNGGTSGVQVKNGYFAVTLGSKTPFGNSVDWNQDTLWLSMNVAGSSASCTTFDQGTCAADGEMLPMKRLTATPYAMNAGKVGGKTADNFVQLAQGVQTDASTNTSSIHINKTGTGNLLQLQNTATDVFTIASNGNLTFGSNADHSISVATSTGSDPGRSFTISAGSGGSGAGAYGGDLVLQGGDAGGTSENGGSVAIDAGTSTGGGTGGTISIGTSNASGITIGRVGAITTVDGTLKTNDIDSNDGLTVKVNGGTKATFDDTNTLYLGNGATSTGPTDFSIQSTSSTSDGVAAGSLTIQAGNAYNGNANGGNITLDAGAKSGTGVNGAVSIGTANAASVTIGSVAGNILTSINGRTLVKSSTGNNSTSAFQVQNASAAALFTADTSSMEVVIGNSGNTITLSSSGISFAGTARGTKSIRLAAEYENTVLDNGTGNNNSGTMLSSLDLTNRMNFYRWSSAETSAQTYDIVTQVAIPQDFSAWAASNPLSITSRTNNTSNGTASLELRDSSGTIRCNFTALSMGSTNTWTTNTPNCLSTGTYTPGDYLTLRIRTSSTNNANVDMGNIVLNYLSNK